MFWPSHNNAQLAAVWPPNVMADPFDAQLHTAVFFLIRPSRQWENWERKRQNSMGRRVANSISNLFPIMSTSITSCSAKPFCCDIDNVYKPIIQLKESTCYNSVASLSLRWWKKNILFSPHFLVRFYSVAFSPQSQNSTGYKKKENRVNFCDLAKYLAALLGLPSSL